MKFLENSKLEALSNALSTDSGDIRLDVRLESYSCKLVKSDKRQLSSVFGPGTSPHDLQPLSPPTDALGAGPLFPPPGKLRRVSGGSDTGDEEKGGVLCDSINRKMLFNLTTLLNSAFPDYDFGHAKAAAFSQIPDIPAVMRVLDTHLAPVCEPYERLKSRFWATIDEEIQLKDCLIYSYNPEYLGDPFSEDGGVWSFNFFFYNRPLKRILFACCRASSGMGGSAEEMSDDILWDIDE